MGDWREELRARGYRLTPQRELVLEAVQDLNHATPDEILARVRSTAAGINISTVYRTLELLEELGLVTHTHLDHGAPAYHSMTEPDHVHLVCRTCRKIIQVAPEVCDGLVQRLEGELGFQPDVRHLTVFGICQECANV